MKDHYSNPHESLWRRPRSDAERAALRAQPDAELEARLTDALAKVPDVPVPSNFTVRVLDTIELEERQAARACGHWNWRRLLPRLAVGTAILLVAGISIQRYETISHRTTLAKELASAAGTQAPDADALKDLDAIQRMSQSGHADGDLLVALQ